MSVRQRPEDAFIAPRALAKGARIRIVAPASPFPKDDFEKGVTRLRERYEVSYDEGIYRAQGYLAGDDERRAAELVDALEDETVDAILAARGGYGVTRLLDALDVDLIRRAGKPLIGFSDITALHALWAQAGLRSIHGHMVAALGRADGGVVARWIRAVEGAVPEALTELTPVAPGRAEGPLLGGNLAVLCALLGTDFLPPLEGAVLFLEDVGERPFRVDRMLTSLRQAGVFDRITGIALGAFIDCHTGTEGTTVEDVLGERLGDLGLPVVSGVPSGHFKENLELPFGAPVVVDGDAGALTFLAGAFQKESKNADG